MFAFRSDLLRMVSISFLHTNAGVILGGFMELFDSQSAY